MMDVDGVEGRVRMPWSLRHFQIRPDLDAGLLDKVVNTRDIAAEELAFGLVTVT